jgi:tetratricopeptide (TPR) repeat protein
MFGRPKSFNRSEVLAAADKARSKGHHKKAIADYRKILEVDPNDPAVHAKIAPLLGVTRQYPDAWKSFVLAAEDHIKKGFQEKGIAVYTQATAFFPREVTLWETIAKLHYEKGRPSESVKVLVEGSRHFHKKAFRGEGIRLLRRALEMDARHVVANLEISLLLAKQRQRMEAMTVLVELATWLKGSQLRKVRGRLFGLSPSPVTAFHWARAALFGK